jgi:ABC-2 type transport system ATP-binding protein
MIEVQDLSKRYGDKLAVDHLSFTVDAGTVTGFLGPNGAGKSTTMRLIVGLDHPTSGTATIDGKRYAELHQPLRVVGALLEAGSVHPGRSAHNHLLFLAQTQALPRRRVDEVIDLVGLCDVARERVGGFSLGMRQRLGIAAALLGDPKVLILDEPINGLDPEGIMWVRTLLRRLADEGRTVLVSSHLMSEMSQTADNLIVIGRGSLIAQSTMAEFIERNSDQSVIVRAPDSAALRSILLEAGGQVTAGEDHALIVQHLTAARIGDLAAAAGLALHELSPQLASLEDAFMETTQDSVDFGGTEDLPREADLVAAGTTERSTR